MILEIHAEGNLNCEQLIDIINDDNLPTDISLIKIDLTKSILKLTYNDIKQIVETAKHHIETINVEKIAVLAQTPMETTYSILAKRFLCDATDWMRIFYSNKMANNWLLSD